MAIIDGDEMDNVLIGTSDADQMKGKEGDDIVKGKGGDDILAGGRGNDKVVGGGGDDVLRDGNGQDKLKGGAGADTFQFVFPESGIVRRETILDFEDGVDCIDMNELGGEFLLDFSDLTITDKANGDVLIKTDLGGFGTKKITLKDVDGTLDAADLTADDFKFFDFDVF